MQDLRRLQAANGGDSTAFDRMLDLAYGRIGKLRWELMEVCTLAFTLTPSSLTMSTSLYSWMRVLRSVPQQAYAKRKPAYPRTPRNSSRSLLQVFPAQQDRCKSISLFHLLDYEAMQNRTVKIECYWDHRADAANIIFDGASSGTNGRRCIPLFRCHCSIWMQIISTCILSQILDSNLVSRMTSSSRSCSR